MLLKVCVRLVLIHVLLVRKLLQLYVLHVLLIGLFPINCVNVYPFIMMMVHSLYVEHVTIVVKHVEEQEHHLVLPVIVVNSDNFSSIFVNVKTDIMTMELYYVSNVFFHV